MALFNRKNKKRQQMTTNRAGGKAYTSTPELKLASILLTSFANNQFYRKQSDTFTEVIQLLSKVDPLFAAKAALYARTEFGMRSITHVLAAELSAYISGQPWAKSFYDKIVYRPDDMLEILAYYKGKGGKSIPNAMKKGFAASFDRFDAYQISKYKGENRDFKLVDAVNLVRPKPSNRNAIALRKLVAGELVSTKTWEAKLTKAGQTAKNDIDKKLKKARAWEDLIKNRKIGYFALLRNLRNIAEQAPGLTDNVCKLLRNEVAIKNSKVLPFRYITALDAVQELKSRGIKNKLTKALNSALDVAMDNVPVFEGKTLVVLDDSGSMTWSNLKGSNKTPIQIGALFAAVLFKSNNADLMRFSNDASYLNYNIGDATMSIANRLVKNAISGGTNFHSIFQKADDAYDRIIILSDMQGWIGRHTPSEAFKAYKQKTGANPLIYSFDLAGYGSLQFPERNVFALAGFSEKIFDIMSVLETNRNALVDKINAITL